MKEVHVFSFYQWAATFNEQTKFNLGIPYLACNTDKCLKFFICGSTNLKNKSAGKAQPICKNKNAN